MYEHNDSFIAWGNETLSSNLYMTQGKLADVLEKENISLEPPKSDEGSEESA